MFSVHIDRGDVALIVQKLNRAQAVMRSGVLGMMPAVGKLIESQVKHRIRSEKTSPDGEAWKPNIRGNPTLVLSGALVNSINARSSLFMTTVRPGVHYARIQNNGGRMSGNMWFEIHGRWYHKTSVILPSREFMGLSPANVAQVWRMTDWYWRRGFGWL
jgi:phage gpG-like protein